MDNGTITDTTGRTAKQNRDLVLLLMSPVLVLAGLAFLWSLLYLPVAPNVDKTELGVVAGFVMGTVISPIIQFWFGASKSGADSTDHLNARP